jgi:hypothetical protein
MHLLFIGGFSMLSVFCGKRPHLRPCHSRESGNPYTWDNIYLQSADAPSPCQAGFPDKPGTPTPFVIPSAVEESIEIW